MKFARLGKAYLDQARVWLETGESALRKKNYAFAVLAAQECVEFSLKGALKRLGVEYPRTHDTGLVLLGNRDRLPRNMLSKLEWLVDVSRRLAIKRSQAAYGDEAEGVPAGLLFDKSDAVGALRDAKAVLARCSETPAKRLARKTALVKVRVRYPVRPLKELKGIVAGMGAKGLRDEGTKR